MKFKVFNGKGNNQKSYDNIEKKINDWLVANPKVKVVAAVHDSMGTWTGVFYTNYE